MSAKTAWDRALEIIQDDEIDISKLPIGALELIGGASPAESRQLVAIRLLNQFGMLDLVGGSMYLDDPSPRAEVWVGGDDVEMFFFDESTSELLVDNVRCDAVRFGDVLFRINWASYDQSCIGRVC